jgi:Sulfotransferase domain
MQSSIVADATGVLDREAASGRAGMLGIHPFHRRAWQHLDLRRHAGRDLPPSFFVVGAPRCGTTSLSRALTQHPQISFSKPKETHYLLLAPAELSDDELRALYISLHHKELGPQHEAIGDGSVSYLYAGEAIRQALRFDERARFIVTVRNPVDMLPSYHARMVYTLDENVSDFAQAWALQTHRAAGQHVPRRCRDARLLQYGEVGRLGAHIERLFEVAGRDRCLVVVFDDFVSEPRSVYRKVLEFVGVEDDGRTRFPHKAENRGFASPWLQQFVMNPPPWAVRLVEVANGTIIRRMKRVRRRLKRFNTVRQERPKLQDGMRETLRDHFADDVRKLSALLDRDLRHWLD